MFRGPVRTSSVRRLGWRRHSMFLALLSVARHRVMARYLAVILSGVRFFCFNINALGSSLPKVKWFMQMYLSLTSRQDLGSQKAVRH